MAIYLLFYISSAFFVVVTQCILLVTHFFYFFFHFNPYQLGVSLAVGIAALWMANCLRVIELCITFDAQTHKFEFLPQQFLYCFANSF